MNNETPAPQLIAFTKHFKGLDLPGLASALSEMGAAGADLCVRPGYPVEPATAPKALPAAAALFKESGLSIPLITLPGEFTDPKADGVEGVFAAAAAAGVRFLKLGYWSMGADGYWASLDRARRGLQGFSALAEKHHVTVLVHNHTATLGLSSSAAMSMVKGLNPKAVAIFADTGHLALAGEPLAMAFSIAGEYLAVIAAKDMVWEGKGGKRRELVVPMGEGYVDWDLLARELHARRFAGPVSIHGEYDLKIESLREQVKRDIAFFKGKFPGALR